MVAFARAKAKSIFSKLRFHKISKSNYETHEKRDIEGLSIQKKRNSNDFLEAIKFGGIWLS